MTDICAPVLVYLVLLTGCVLGGIVLGWLISDWHHNAQ